jgi:hypothetical protein
VTEQEEQPEDEEREETIDDLDVAEDELRFITGGVKVEQPPSG